VRKEVDVDVREANAEHAFDVLGGEAADVVKDGGLIDVILERNEGPEDISE